MEKLQAEKDHLIDDPPAGVFLIDSRGLMN